MTLFPTTPIRRTPTITDADGNVVNKSAFDVARAYINITGNISHIVAFRITPDITRQSGLLTLGTGNSVSSDSLVFRIKYAYAQFNLDDWMTRGSWARLGIQQTPWVDFEEGIYRYRFQGTVFAERIPLPTAMTSSDAGVSFHYNLPSNYGDFHVGVYNGENYQKVEVNNQKALEFRGTLRPFATMAPVLRGLRAHLVYYNDHYAGSDERKRVMGNVTFEHQYLNAGFDYLSAKDQTLATATDASSKGYSVWATPRAPMANGSSWEGLLRYDHFTPNTATTLAPASTSPVPASRAERSAPEPDDCRRVVLVPAPGQRQHRDPPRLRRPELRQHHDGARAEASRCTGCSTSKGGSCLMKTMNTDSWPLAACASRSSPGVARSRRCRSTARARRSRIRSTRSGSPSTTSCTRTSRSTTSRSARAAASGRSPTRRCSSAPPTAR